MSFGRLGSIFGRLGLVTEKTGNASAVAGLPDNATGASEFLIIF